MHEGRPLFFYLLALRKCCGVQPAMAMRELMVMGVSIAPLIVSAVVMNVWAVATMAIRKTCDSEW